MELGACYSDNRCGRHLIDRFRPVGNVCKTERAPSAHVRFRQPWVGLLDIDIRNWGVHVLRLCHRLAFYGCTVVL